jgi:hypothetical protein
VHSSLGGGDNDFDIGGGVVTEPRTIFAPTALHSNPATMTPASRFDLGHGRDPSGGACVLGGSSPSGGELIR